MTVSPLKIQKLPPLGAPVLALVLAAWMATPVWAAKKERPCWLNLVVSNDSVVPEDSLLAQDAGRKAAGNAQFLGYLRDLQALGFRFSDLSQETVSQEFKAQSAKNLREMLGNYQTWLERNQRPVVEMLRGREHTFVYWKDHFSPAGGRKHVTLKTDREITTSDWRHRSLWSVALGGFNGVAFNLEEIRELPETFVNSTQGNGIARVALTKVPDWAYVLPLPGSPSGETSYTGVDTRFFGFLAIFAPDVLETFAHRLKTLWPEIKTSKDLLSPNVLRSIAEFSREPESLRYLSGLKEELKYLTLTPEDATELLTYVANQWKASGNLMPGFDVVKDGAVHSLTAVVSGEVHPEDYVLKERPYVPPFVGPGGVKGWRVRPGSKIAPNMTGDTLMIPDGPQMH